MAKVQTFYGDIEVKGKILNDGLIVEKATSADKLNTDAGSSTTPVYFSNGIPIAITSFDGNSATATKATTADTATKATTADTATKATTADTATKATQDASGNVITTTYVQKASFSLSGATLTITIS